MKTNDEINTLGNITFFQDAHQKAITGKEKMYILLVRNRVFEK
jgi:hypothetical protein